MGQAPGTAASVSAPTPDVALEAVGLIIETRLRMLPRKEARRFLRTMAEIQADREAMAAIVPIRPGSRTERRREVERDLFAWFEASLPKWLAAVESA